MQGDGLGLLGDSPILPDFAVREGLRDPRLYLLERPLRGTEFVRLAQECGLEVSVTLLAWYEEQDLLRPCLLMVGEHHYSRWQLLQLAHLEHVRALGEKVVDGLPIDRQGRRAWRDLIAMNSSQLLVWTDRFYQWLELVVLAQNRFVERARGHLGYAQMQRNSSGREDEEDAWLEGEYRQRLSAGLSEIGLSLTDAQSLREQFGLSIHHDDPLGSWYRLLRFVPMNRRQQLKGAPRLAQELYVADRVLQLWLEEMTGQRQSDTEELGLDPRYDWARRLFGRPKDYRDPSLRETVLTQFGLHPAPRGVFFLDGETEEDLIPGIVRLFGYSLPQLGVEVQALRGGQNVDRMLELINHLAKPVAAGERVHKHYILQRPVTHVWAFIDRETGGLAHGQRQKLVDLLERKQLGHTLILSDPDLERENFGDDLVECLSEVLGQPVPDEVVLRWRDSRGRSLEHLFRDLRVRIGKRDLVPVYLKRIEADLVATRDPEKSRYPIVRNVFRVVLTLLGSRASSDPRLKDYGYYG